MAEVMAEVTVEVTRLARYRAGVPVYRYVVDPSVPPVSVLRLTREPLRRVGVHPHAHEFPALLYFERDGPPGGRFGPVRAGDVYVVAPGVVPTAGEPDALLDAGGVAVFFLADELEPGRPVPPPSWRSHPLLFPFVHGAADGLLRLRVPARDRERWSAGIAAIEAELAARRDGYRQAALAHLTLLLVDVARLAAEVIGAARPGDERLLAEVFAVIERRYGERLSLRDVARAVNLSPGHLTTSVRRRTGRTVQDWITERRMAEARRLLAETDRTVAEIGREVGIPDPGYFARVFRREHGKTPRAWRRTRPTP